MNRNGYSNSTEHLDIIHEMFVTIQMKILCENVLQRFEYNLYHCKVAAGQHFQFLSFYEKLITFLHFLGNALVKLQRSISSQQVDRIGKTKKQFIGNPKHFPLRYHLTLFPIWKNKIEVLQVFITKIFSR